MRIQYGQPIRSAITAAGIVGYAANNSRIRGHTYPPASPSAHVDTSASPHCTVPLLEAGLGFYSSSVELAPATSPRATPVRPLEHDRKILG